MSSYPLTKISDLLTVPFEKREACVKDLLYGLMLHELAFGDEAGEIEMESLIWTDDGDHSVTLEDTNGERVLSLKLSKEVAV